MRVQLRHAILGLISLRPQSGYDLGRAFAKSVAHFWYADQSQIYRTIARLEADGAIVTEVIEQSGRPDRRVHSLSSSGRAELDGWLASPLEVERTKDPFLARVFFAAALGAEGVEELLAERERQAKATLAQLPALPQAVEDLTSELQLATLRAGVAYYEAELAWLADTRRRVAQHRDPQ